MLLWNPRLCCIVFVFLCYIMFVFIHMCETGNTHFAKFAIVNEFWTMSVNESAESQSIFPAVEEKKQRGKGVSLPQAWRTIQHSKQKTAKKLHGHNIHLCFQQQMTIFCNITSHLCYVLCVYPSLSFFLSDKKTTGVWSEGSLTAPVAYLCRAEEQHAALQHGSDCHSTSNSSHKTPLTGLQ